MNPWGHTCLSPSSKINDAQKLSCHVKARCGPSNHSIKAGQRKIPPVWAAAGARAFTVSPYAVRQQAHSK